MSVLMTLHPWMPTSVLVEIKYSQLEVSINNEQMAPGHEKNH